MADKTATGAAEQGSGAAGTQGGTAQPGQGQAGSEEAYDKDRALETIRRQRESEADKQRLLTEAVGREKTIQAELDALKASTASEGDKAITRAKREGVAEATTKYEAQLRRAGVKAALAAAGVSAELLDLAMKDDVFAGLKVNDDFEIEGLEGAITALRKARPSLFAKAGDFGGGNRGATPPTAISTNDALRVLIRNG